MTNFWFEFHSLQDCFILFSQSCNIAHDCYFLLYWYINPILNLSIENWAVKNLCGGIACWWRKMPSQNMIQATGFRHLLQERIKHSLDLLVSIHWLWGWDQMINIDQTPNCYINSLISIKYAISIIAGNLETCKNLSGS